jgi:hypothetical protein
VQLLTGGLSKLERFPDGAAGLALDDFRRDGERVLVQAIAWEAGDPPPDPALFPLLRSR